MKCNTQREVKFTVHQCELHSANWTAVQCPMEKNRSQVCQQWGQTTLIFYSLPQLTVLTAVHIWGHTILIALNSPLSWQWRVYSCMWTCTVYMYVLMEAIAICMLYCVSQQIFLDLIEEVDVIIDKTVCLWYARLLNVFLWMCLPLPLPLPPLSPGHYYCCRDPGQGKPHPFLIMCVCSYT